MLITSFSLLSEKIYSITKIIIVNLKINLIYKSVVLNGSSLSLNVI